MPADNGEEFVTHRHFAREIELLREFARTRVDATDRSIEAHYANIGNNYLALNRQIATLQTQVSDLTGRLDRAEGGTARHSATIAMAVSISAVIMSLVVGGLSIIKTSSHPEVVYQKEPHSPPNVDGS